MRVLTDRSVALLAVLLLAAGCASSARHQSAETIPGTYLVVLDESVLDPNEADPQLEGIRRNIVPVYHLIKETMEDTLQSVEFSADPNAVRTAGYDAVLRLTIRRGLQGPQDRDVILETGQTFTLPSEPTFTAQLTLYTVGEEDASFNVIYEQQRQEFGRSRRVAGSNERSPASAEYEFTMELAESLRQHLGGAS